MRGLDLPVAAVPGRRRRATPDSDVLWRRTPRGAGSTWAALPWYLGFAFFKIAAIFEGIHYRSQQGLTVGEGFDRLGALVPPLVERGHAALSEA